MKRRNFFLIMIIFLAVLLCGCSKEDSKYAGRIKVTYELEGASYKNSRKPIIQYYGRNGEESLVYEPSTLPGNGNNLITYPGYELVGWFLEKNVTGSGEDIEITYSNPWDFSTDTIKDKNITLYAFWKKVEKCFYNVCYLDDAGKKQILGSYSASEGAKFIDALNYAKKRTGYTPIQEIVDKKLSVIYYDKDGNVWNNDFVHPGKDASNDGNVDVYVKYLKGTFSFVSNYNELKLNKTKNIYLLNDIDCGGEAFSFGNYASKTLLGNGYTISNFKVQYTANSLVNDYIDGVQNTLYIGIFNELKNATIKDVKLDNVIFDVNTGLSKTKRIVVTPFAKVVTSTIDNVTINASYQVSKLPSSFSKDDLIFVTDRASYLSDDASSVNAKVTINVKGE